MEVYLWIGIACSLLFSAFFSGMEIAIVSSSRLEIELEAKKGLLFSEHISNLLKKSWRIIGAMLVGNNIALVVYGMYMTELLNPVLMPYLTSEIAILLIQTLVSTIIVLFLAEFLPKAVVSLNPNRALNVFKIPFLLTYYLLYVPTLFVIGLSERILKLFIKVDIEDETFNFGIVDLNHYLNKMSKRKTTIENVDNEFLFLRNALEFSSTKARECMIPRNEIEAVELEESIDRLLQIFIETGLSKIMVYRDNVDNIIGFIHSSAMFENPDTIKQHIQTVMIVPESMKANDIMKNFISNKKNVAVVVDEFGGTSGIITREDLLEEIFGEIDDEYDSEDLIENQLSETEFEFSARLEIDYINENYDLNIQKDADYETLAGFILSHTESIPSEGDKLSIGKFEIVVSKVSESRIDQVVLKLKEEE
jgi:CBS domain containing-hemolysin-like protein